MDYTRFISSPVGQLTVASDGHAITGLWLEGQKYYTATLEKEHEMRDIPVFQLVQDWLNIYFKGKQPEFSLPLAPRGSLFRQNVWNILCEIPYGTVVTYGSIAKQLNESGQGIHTSPRAVGGAVGHNPVSILIPCHRVIGSDGSLTGYAGGIDKKIQLLNLEHVEMGRLGTPYCKKKIEFKRGDSG